MVYTNKNETKETRKVTITVPLEKELRIVQKFLKKVQKGTKIIWFNNLPDPYSSGNELSARYYGFTNLLLLRDQLLPYLSVIERTILKNEIDAILNITFIGERIQHTLFIPITFKMELDNLDDKQIPKILYIRYFGFEPLHKIILNIINTKIPLNNQEYFKNQLPSTPILDCIKLMDIHLISDRKDQLEIVDMFAHFFSD